MHLSPSTGALMACLLCPQSGLADTIRPPDYAASSAEERFSLNGEYDHFLGEGWFSYAATSFQREHRGEMNRRSVRAIGSGYRIVDTEQLHLSLRAGISAPRETPSSGSHADDASVHWGFDLERAVLGQPLHFFYSQRGIASFDAVNRRTMNMSTGLRIPFASGFSAAAGYDREWELSHEDTSSDAEPTYTFDIGYDW